MAELIQGFSQHKSLTERHKKIVKYLVTMAPNPITTKAISERLNVSQRTILRDIANIEEWMSENDFNFSHKPGVGIQINEEQENLNLIIELVSIDAHNTQYSRSERKRIILDMLFFSNEPLKAYVFISHLKISESTLFADLEQLDIWLANYQVSIIRRKGLGLYLQGSEYNLRQAVTNYILEFSDVDRLLFLLMENPKDEDYEKLKNQPLLVFMEKDIVISALDFIDRVQSLIHTHYTDGGQIRMLIKYALTIYRMKTGHFVEELSMENNRLASMVELSATVRLIGSIEKKLNIKVPQTEVRYIAMMLSATRIWTDASQFKDPSQSMDIWQVVVSMTRIVEQMTGLSFRNNNNKFLDDLINHIRIIEKRIYLDLITENRQTEEIKNQYPDIFNAVDTACEVLREWVYPKELRFPDVGYIALHFISEALRIQQKNQTLQLAVVCPSGIGSSKILAANLKKEFHDIEVVKTMSVININVAALKKEGIDLIVSTVPLTIDFPTVQVYNIMLQTNDKMRLEREFERLFTQALNSTTRNVQSYATFSFDTLETLTHIGMEILEVANHFRIHEQSGITGKEHLLTIAANMFATNQAQSAAIRESLAKREKIRDTYIEEMQLYLFHCITDTVDHCRFGYIRLKDPFIQDHHTVDGAIVMIVPGSNNDALEIVGRLSELLVEESGFLQALKENNEANSQSFIKDALVKHFKSKVQNS